MRKIYFIHENTIPIKIDGTHVHVCTDYVVTVGFVDGTNTGTIYLTDEKIGTVKNHIHGIVWDTFDEGEKHLTKLLSSISFNYSTNIKKRFDRLKEKYPEMII